MSLDISLSQVLSVAPLMHQFRKQNSTQVALAGLQILIAAKVWNETAQTWHDYLESKGINTINTPEITSVMENSPQAQEKIHKNTTAAVKEALWSNTYLSQPAEAKALYAQIKNALYISVLNSEYERALQYLSDFSTIVSFSSQPKDRAHFVDNMYLDFLCHQYAINIHHLLWFPYHDRTKESSANFTTGSGAFKAVDTIYKKLVFYYTRNEAVLASSSDVSDEVDAEVAYYWFARTLNLAVLFKRLQFDDFYSEFGAITSSGKSFFVELDYFWKSKILCMLAIVFIFLRPFNELALLDDSSNMLVDLFTANEESTENQLYSQLLVPLSQSKFAQVLDLLRDPTFTTRFAAQLGFCVPLAAAEVSESTPVLEHGPSYRFLAHVSLMITLKNALLVLGSITEVPRPKLMDLLGTTKDAESVHRNLLLLIASLGLGKRGVGYRYADDVYYNVGPDRSVNTADLQDEIESLANDVEAETMASLMKASLLEKLAE